MTFNLKDVRDLLSHLEAEADGRDVEGELARAEAERLMALYPGMANILAPIAERHSRRAA
ncbi:hypothetical protein WV31_08860 [Magnetospirillum sp. ME-1]|uniref:hypothetical protein n=1 Tax=Magnetospirillum sp. ME-1 TaxID=1639348 RepID=UPI000A17AD36|nr:hypothetical protein [Magnetospirillum sp. ME-1]ARJ65758.1 hypothetical protein WV31_08860 [Magnetospirillum sp. ME-1]